MAFRCLQVDLLAYTQGVSVNAGLAGLNQMQCAYGADRPSTDDTDPDA